MLQRTNNALAICQQTVEPRYYSFCVSHTASYNRYYVAFGDNTTHFWQSRVESASDGSRVQDQDTCAWKQHVMLCPRYARNASRHKKGGGCRSLPLPRYTYIVTWKSSMISICCIMLHGELYEF